MQRFPVAERASIRTELPCESPRRRITIECRCPPRASPTFRFILPKQK